MTGRAVPRDIFFLLLVSEASMLVRKGERETQSLPKTRKVEQTLNKGNKTSTHVRIARQPNVLRRPRFGHNGSRLFVLYFFLTCLVEGKVGQNRNGVKNIHRKKTQRVVVLEFS